MPAHPPLFDSANPTTVEKRSPANCAVLGVVTCGIYCIYWFLQTAREMNLAGAQIPSGWFMAIPGANLWWFWRWCVGVQRYTRGYLGAGTALIFLLVVPLTQMAGIFTEGARGTAVVWLGVVLAILSLACISVPILQSSLNRYRDQHIVTAFD